MLYYELSRSLVEKVPYHLTSCRQAMMALEPLELKNCLINQELSKGILWVLNIFLPMTAL